MEINLHILGDNESEVVLKLPLKENERVKNLGIQLDESDKENPVIDVVVMTTDETTVDDGKLL